MGTIRRYSENGTIEITIDDLADHSPVFIQQNYSVTVSEDTPQITSVLRVSICRLSAHGAMSRLIILS